MSDYYTNMAQASARSTARKSGHGAIAIIVRAVKQDPQISEAAMGASNVDAGDLELSAATCITAAIQNLQEEACECDVCAPRLDRLTRAMAVLNEINTDLSKGALDS